MHTTEQRRAVPLRRRLAAVGTVLALSAGAVTALAAPASADTTVTGGSLSWGFKQSFRTYVGDQLGALTPPGPAPAGERIIPMAPGAFDPTATPVNEKRPYVFPVGSGSVGSATAVSLTTAGGVAYHFPSHGFEVRLQNFKLVVDGTGATIYADTYVNATLEFGEFPLGVTTATQIPFAHSNAVTVTVAPDGASATISATEVKLTAEGSAALPLYEVGTDLDNFSASAVLNDPDVPQTPNGSVTVSKTVVNPDGDTVTVTGTGFFPTVNGTRPPLSGTPGGVYVTFARFADVWQPSAGAPSASRPTNSTGAAGFTKWAVLAGDIATIGGAPAGAIELHPDGTFTATLNVKEAYRDPLPATGNFGIYTYGAAGATSAGYETFTPITFAQQPDDNQQQIVATVPEPTPGGEFLWTIDATDRTVDLGTMTNQGAYYQATGSIKAVVVTDTRTNQGNAWSVSGQLSDFDNGLSGGYLGWTPSVVAPGAGATAGATVTSGFVGGDGLSVSSVLGSGADGHATGSGTLGAGLDLRFPIETEAGTVHAVLTLTALS